MLLLPESGSLVRQDEERNDDSSKASLPGRRRGSNSRLPSLATLVSSLVIRSNIKFPLKIHFASETICKMTFYPLLKKRGKKNSPISISGVKEFKEELNIYKIWAEIINKVFCGWKNIAYIVRNLERLKVGSNNGFTNVTSYDTVKVSLEKKRRLLLNLRADLKKNTQASGSQGHLGFRNKHVFNKVNQVYPLC